MPRHQILTRLSRYFPLVWIDRPLEWRAAWRRNSAPDHTGELPVDPDFLFLRPGRLLPRVYRPRFLADLTERGRISRARRMLLRRRADLDILYLWRPESAPLLDLVPHRVSCYHVDDEYSFSTTDHPVPEQEIKLLSRASQVILHSPGLWEKRQPYSTRAAFVPNGVDYPAFSTPVPEPESLRNIPHPRIGYIGVIKDQLNLALLVALAEEHPGWSFVLVGPARNLRDDLPAYQALQRLSNVHLLGSKTVVELPGYAQHIDVGLMPYDHDEYTKYIYPLKLHEYLAAGIPIVSTPIRTVLDFQEVVSIASTEAEWSDAIAAALGPEAHDPEVIAFRRRVARRHDWGVLVARIAGLLAERLGPPWPERVAEVVPYGVRRLLADRST